VFQLFLKEEKTIVGMIKHLKQTENIEVKVLKCDNAG
jgi:hypothetical protein